MKNLKKLGVLLSVGTIAAFGFSLAACGGDDDDSTPSGGTGGSTAGTGTTAGTGGAAAGTASTGGAGSGSGGSSAGTASGGGGAGGASGGTGGASGGTGGASGGSGGSGGASGGSGGSGGGGPSADCMKWCSGPNGLIQQCAGKLAAAVDTEQKCLAECNNDAAKGDMGLACWNKHLAFIVGGMDKTTHCPHASGAPGNGQCNETK